ncbi:aldehyde dehydrogenase family protein [Streptomyces dangxiongensis]|uniref:aldehyde dehydrogenase (NAD(+)) n=1 Tax=Streptomyces dangxiongensis TaxID=1442032 RepID=A0A3G2JIM2_9ACTN|nr:aldehyde dehydrogenase family protein [Streptomyces dangxiongensis]AYN39407.1 aldehyde dehydrogenase family protein [Streptomyces dangxiongensis]
MDSLPLGSVYLNGRWTAPETRETLPVENPATETEIGRVPACGAADVRRAVAAAGAAGAGWAATDPAARAGVLLALRDALAEHHEDMARLITREMGSPLTFSRRVQAGLPLKVLEGFAEALTADPGEERVGHSLVVREPAGVVGAITPWNYPLHQVIAKVGAALAAGCTVVLKPSELAPLSAYFLTTLIDGLGLPPGVFNLVPGRGTEAGRALAADAGVDVVSFTGSLRAGREVGSVAGGGVKRVCLELGGKSATVVLPDADLATAVTDGVRSALHNAGQTCSARSRLLVPRSRTDEAVDVVRSVLAGYVPGDPADPGCRLGPLVSRAQRDRVLEHVRAAEAGGARRVAGSPQDEVPARGHYVAAGAWTGVPADAPLAQEEVFGPVLVVLPFDDEADAVRLANSTPYGLAATVWSADPDRATAVARRLRAGQVDINDAAFNPAAPFGGYGMSGVGRELGAHGIREFQDTKSLQLPA